MSDEAQLASPSRINIFNPVFFVVGSRAGKDQCVTRSLFQFSRLEREFLSFNLMFKTGTRISFPQYLTSRRVFHFSISGFETRSKIEIETIFARIFGNYIFCLFIDRYFQKKTVIFSKFLRIICLFFSRNLNKNLIFRDENGNFFSTSRVSRREREFFYSNLVFREGDENLKIISQGRARKNEPNSHENSRDREFSLCSGVGLVIGGGPPIRGGPNV